METIKEIAALLKDADGVIVGGGSGLSSAAGYNHYHYEGTFRQHFQEFDDAYGIKSLMKGFYYVYSKPEQQWGFYTRYIRFMHKAPVGQPYRDLWEILKDKNYFVLTTNVDMQFTRLFPKEKVCCFQGEFRYFQCGQPCCDRLFDAEPLVESMEQSMQGLEVPAQKIPRCPECGWKMVPWVQDDTFLQGEYWEQSYKRYSDFVKANRDKKLVLLELGVGDMTPSIIKLPFWQMAAAGPRTVLVNVTLDKTTPPLHLKGRHLNVRMDLGEFLAKLKKEMLCPKKEETV